MYLIVMAETGHRLELLGGDQTDVESFVDSSLFDLIHVRSSSAELATTTGLDQVWRIENAT